MIHFEDGRWNRVVRTWDINGVASAKVVVVPASRAKRARRSISFPGSPSTLFPRSAKHEAEAHGEHQVERPRDRTPVEERVGAGPGLHRAHLGDMRVVGVEEPLTEGVEQDVSGEAGGEHHAGPHEERVFRLLIRLSEADISKPGESQKQGEQEDEQAYCEVEESECVSEDESDRVEDAF